MDDPLFALQEEVGEDDEPERKGALLELARTLVREMEGQPSEVVPELLWMLDDELHQMPRRLVRSIMLD